MEYYKNTLSWSKKKVVKTKRNKGQMRQMENKYLDDKFELNISMITIKCKCSKHFSSKVEVIRS